MKVLVTGGCGFVGRHFARYYLNAGDVVTAVDDLSAGIEPARWRFKSDSRFRHNLKFVHSDVRNFFKLYKPDEFDLIIHCAAVVGGRLKIDGDPLAVATDLSIDSQFFDWVVRARSKPKVIYFSSSAVYPLDRQTRESNCELFEALVDTNALEWRKPDMTYGFVKFAGEYLCQFAAQNYGLDVKIYRPFGGYGEDQSLDYPFPSIVRRVTSGENPVVVWGSGEQMRDFVHIDDVVDCVVRTMDSLQPGETLNIGTGIRTSFKQLARMVAQRAGKNLKVVNDVDKPEGVFCRVAGTRRLNQLWQPSISLERGIDRMLSGLTGRS